MTMTVIMMVMMMVMKLSRPYSSATNDTTVLIILLFSCPISLGKGLEVPALISNIF